MEEIIHADMVFVMDKGHVAMEGTPREIFSRVEELKALRLDVYEGNLPAIRLYESAGFRYAGTVSLGLEDIGLDWFRLYEKMLQRHGDRRDA